MVHVGEQKTPVTKRIYAPYDKKNQHNKCRAQRTQAQRSLSASCAPHYLLLSFYCRSYYFSPTIFFLPSVIKQQIILQTPVIVQCFPTFLHRRECAVRFSHTGRADHRIFFPHSGQTALQGRQRRSQFFSTSIAR